jgi:hypothetical protein
MTQEIKRVSFPSRLSTRISLIVFKHYLYLVYAIKILCFIIELRPLAMFHPFINEIERKSKSITHFLLARRGPEAQG